MQTELADFMKDTPDGEEAAAIIGRCVHCGFCNATCPSYQLLGDELDGPRGRIYLIKQVLEGSTPSASTRLHLDRCLGCRACETTCPSGVQYGRLLDIGRSAVAQRTRRPAGQAALRWLLRTGLSSRLFAPALALGRVLRPLLPAVLRDHIPLARAPGAWPARPHSRRMLLLAGCVQPAMLPNINAATARVLDALGVQLVVPPHAGCCGALHQHLDDPVGAQRMARRNIDAWWPHIESGCEAILVNASGCGAHVTEYAHLLRHDPGYAERARRVSTLAKDPCEVLPALLAMRPIRQPRQRPRVTFHPPCTLQHGLKIRGAVETMLTALGCELLPYAETHLCCGAAGTYSLTQPEIADALRERKLMHLGNAAPELILSTNVGCIAHLQAGTKTPVRHWIEWLDDNIKEICP
ncbi:MAG: glycolate oxidase subunit GlcF [Pseudomonadales bacterium]|jgi:glycolate oxidase iron-sulfur subunit|nr:glycolate oxidase subunit GlcF [Pseudomonadales bacterium]MCP5337158.1 glycolate oxidase subunit GlcF [Pseudomonadales bacterium]